MDVEMARGLENGGDDPEQDGRDGHLPGQRVERVGAPAMVADMDDGDRPGEARQQQPDVAPDDALVVPVEARRVGQHDDAGDAEQHASKGAPADLLADQQGHRHDPQRGGVGEHARSAGRQALHAQVGEGEEAGELQDADRQDDRPVGARRHSHAAEGGEQGEGHCCRQGGAGCGEPERRAGLQADLHHRPAEAEQDDVQRELDVGGAMEAGSTHGLLLGARHSSGAS